MTILATLFAGGQALIGRNGLLVAAIAGLVTFYWLADNSAAQRGRAQAIAEQGKPIMRSTQRWLRLGGLLSILALGVLDPISGTEVKPKTRVVVGSFVPIAASSADTCATQIAVAKHNAMLDSIRTGKATKYEAPASGRRRGRHHDGGAHAARERLVSTAAAPERLGWQTEHRLDEQERLTAGLPDLHARLSRLETRLGSLSRRSLGDWAVQHRRKLTLYVLLGLLLSGNLSLAEIKGDDQARAAVLGRPRRHPQKLSRHELAVLAGVLAAAALMAFRIVT